MNSREITVDFDRRRRLEAVLGAGNVGFCYQCGACVGDCPTARFHPGFNPRTIMLEALLGNIDELVALDSIIWLCSNCYTCYERCPQDVRPVEVIIALKNLATMEDTAPSDIPEVTRRIRETGRSVPVMQVVARMRGELGLPPLDQIDVTELKELLRPESEDHEE